MRVHNELRLASWFLMEQQVNDVPCLLVRVQLRTIFPGLAALTKSIHRSSTDRRRISSLATLGRFRLSMFGRDESFT
jgi:hypothetical protein